MEWVCGILFLPSSISKNKISNWFRYCCFFISLQSDTFEVQQHVLIRRCLFVVSRCLNFEMLLFVYRLLFVNFFVFFSRFSPCSLLIVALLHLNDWLFIATNLISLNCFEQYFICIRSTIIMAFMWLSVFLSFSL